MPFIQTPRLNIHYRQAGAGDQAVILLHGNFASGCWWLPVLQRVPAGYRFYAPDLRGCGATDKPRSGHTIQQLAADLAGFVEALHLQHFYLMGHSIGGAVALQFALDHPRLSPGLMLVTPAPAEGLPVRRSTEGHRWLSPDTLARLMPAIVLHKPVLAQALKHALPGLHDKAMRKILVEEGLRISPLAVTGMLQSLSRWNIQARLAELPMPVLILAGALDPLIPLDALVHTAQGLPMARLLIWKDTGHGPQLEHPERFRALLHEFLKDPAARMAEEVESAVEPVLEPRRSRLRRLLDKLLKAGT